jgi:hypothetical protein
MAHGDAVMRHGAPYLRRAGRIRDASCGCSRRKIRQGRRDLEGSDHTLGVARFDAGVPARARSR